MRTVLFPTPEPRANKATAIPPAAMAMGAVKMLVNTLACMPPRGMMLQVIP